MNIKSLRGPEVDGEYPVINITKRDPLIAAAVSKLERNDRTSVAYGNDGNRRTDLLNTGTFQGILSRRARSNSDIAAVLKLLPDLALSKQIMISCILSPKDMVSTDLLYLPPKALFAPELASSLLTRIKRYFDEEYKIQEKLTLMLEEALFDKGSYPIAVLPENAIDDFINGSKAITMESYSTIGSVNGSVVKHIGILGSGQSHTKEAAIGLEGIHNGVNRSNSLNYDSKLQINDVNDIYVSEQYITITDNIHILKRPLLNALLNKKEVVNQYSKHTKSLSIESMDKDLKDIDIDKLIFRNRSHTHEVVANIKTSSEINRKSIGKPLVMKLPSESVIPVHVPGNVRDHIGYFIILDQEGNPVNSADDHGNTTVGGGGTTLGTSLIKKAEASIGGGSNCFDSGNNQHNLMMAKIYSDVIEKDLINRVKNGIYTTDLAIAKNEEVYRIMLARVLSKKQTQILYIPAEFLTYIAFDYTDDGIGKSILDDTMTVNTMRVTAMFTDMLASVKNSIGRTKVAVEIPDKDPNPAKTVERIMDEIVKSRSVTLPMGVSNPNDITDYIQRAGYEWQISGHPGLPDLKIDFEQVNSNHAKVDTDLNDNLRKSSISGIGLTPEIVDNGFSAEFATTSIANNALLSKRVLQKQQIYTPQVSDHLRKVAKYSQGLIEDLKGILEENSDKINLELDEISDSNTASISSDVKKRIIISKALQDLLNGFYVELPKPNSVTLTQQLDDLKTYSDGLDVALEAYIADTFMTDTTTGTIATEVTVLRALIKAHLVRKWLSDKGVLPELSELTSIGEDGKPLFNLPEIVKAHLEALSLSGISTIAEVQKVIKNNNAEMEKINPEPSAETSDSDNTTDNSDNADAASTDAASEEEPADNKAVGDDDALDDIE